MGKFGNCCCETGCCDGSENPVITITGWTQSDFTATADNCCRQYDFTRDSTAAVESCCDQVAQHSMTFECVRDDYVAINPDPKVSLTTLPCPLPDDYCCIAASEKIGTITTTSTVEETHYFAAKITANNLKVLWGKEEIDCGSGPVCRYFVKVQFHGNYNAAINTVVRQYGSVSGSSLTSCYVYDGSLEETWDTNNNPDNEECETDFGTPSGCDCTGSECLTASGTFCIERIKFFSSAPTGAITFTSADTIGACDEPSCNFDCDGHSYDQEICISPPASIYPPWWCSNPPTVDTVNTTYTYLSECTGSQTVLIIDPFDCCNPTNQICLTENDCDPPAEFVQRCDTIIYQEYTCVPEECRFPTCYPEWASRAETCACANGQLFFPAWYDKASDCTTSPCNAACCYEPYVCVDCPYCYPKYDEFYYKANNEITITTNCGAYTKPADCCWTPPDITINISY